MARDPDLLTSYLTALDGALGGVWPRRAELLAEARSHLEDATDAGLARGLTREQAEGEAVRRFGPAGQVAAQFAEARLQVALERSLPTLAVAATALVASAGLEAWFPVSGPFLSSDPVPEAAMVLGAGHALLAACLPLGALALWLRQQGRARAESLAHIGLLVLITQGAAGLAVGHTMQALAQHGAISAVPAMLRMGVAVAALFAVMPQLLAHDALDAVRRRAGARAATRAARGRRASASSRPRRRGASPG